MPRFVLLYHDCPPNYERPSHWDFMLESGGVLRTWALEQLPRDWETAHARTSAIHPGCPLIALGNAVTAVRLRDHRREYLEIEGPLSGDRGCVMRVAAGTYRSKHEAPNEWRVSLDSEGLSARVGLSRNETGDDQWTIDAES